MSDPQETAGQPANNPADDGSTPMCIFHNTPMTVMCRECLLMGQKSRETAGHPERATPLAKYLSREYSFNKEKDRAEAMAMGQEIADGIRKELAAQPLGGETERPKRMGLEEVSISGLMLRREGDYAVVEVERLLADGTHKWYEIIREHHDGQYSHIAEPSKIQGMFWKRKS